MLSMGEGCRVKGSFKRAEGRESEAAQAHSLREQREARFWKLPISVMPYDPEGELFFFFFF